MRTQLHAPGARTSNLTANGAQRSWRRAFVTRPGHEAFRSNVRCVTPLGDETTSIS